MRARAQSQDVLGGLLVGLMLNLETFLFHYTSTLGLLGCILIQFINQIEECNTNKSTHRQYGGGRRLNCEVDGVGFELVNKFTSGEMREREASLPPPPSPPPCWKL